MDMTTTKITRRTLFHASAIAASAAPEPAKKVRVGIVGGGFGSTFQWHLHPECKVEAVCDIRPDRLQRLSEVYRCGNTFADFRAMLKHPALDAVGILLDL